ncbi:MAG: hypothetical protein IT289_08075 [Oligoflexia bacterium]|nr:hypothetical protein [Oligoflexia bacterium]
MGRFLGSHKFMISLGIVVPLSLFIFFNNCAGPRMAEVLLSEKFPPKVVTLRANKICPAPGRRLDSTFVTNLASVVGSDGTFLPDEDLDGLSNDLEQDLNLQKLFGIGPAHPDSDVNHDGFGDFTIFRLGITTANQSGLPPCVDRLADTDKDGLKDCEELILGTVKSNPDTDDDGVPDGVEWRARLNPRYNDAALDPDVDGLSNLNEVRQNSPPAFTNSLIINPFGVPLYQYDLQTKVSDFGVCYDLEISNIPVMNIKTGTVNEDGQGAANVVQIMVVEKDGVQSRIQKMTVVFRAEAKDGSRAEFDFDGGQTQSLFLDLPVDTVFEEVPR